MGGCIRKVQTAWPHLVGTGRAISVLFGILGVRNEQSHLVRPGNENVLDWGMEKDYQRPQCHSGLLVPPIGACSHSVVVVPPN